jgi:hypothetical protein
MNRTHFAVLAAVVFGFSCGKDNGPSGHAPRLDMSGDIWKIVVAQVHRTVISQGPKSTVDNLYGDSVSIADAGTEFGYFNYMAFLTCDSLKIYGSMVPDTFRGIYSAYGNTISASIVTATATLNLVLNRDEFNQFWLDFPAVETAYYMTGGASAGSQTFAGIQERDDYIATLDTAFHPAIMDSIVYTTVYYAYIKP